MSTSIIDRVEAFMVSHQGQWINGLVIAQYGGAYAWRSRLSDLRKRGHVIENKQERITGPDGSVTVYSYYRLSEKVAA